MGASKHIHLNDAERDFGAVLDTAEAGVNILIERRGIPFTLQRVWPTTAQSTPVAATTATPAKAANVGGNRSIGFSGGGSDSPSTFSAPTNLGGQPGAKGLRFQLRLRNQH